MSVSATCVVTGWRNYFCNLQLSPVSTLVSLGPHHWLFLILVSSSSFLFKGNKRKLQPIFLYDQKRYISLYICTSVIQLFVHH